MKKKNTKIGMTSRRDRHGSRREVKWLDFSRDRLRSTLPNTTAVVDALEKAQSVRLETLRSTISV